MLLMFFRSNWAAAHVSIAQTAIVFIVGGMLLALLSEFAVTPRILMRENMRLWHGMGVAMYVLQWLCAGVTFWKLTPSRQ
jgi:hypothetical protein